MSSNSSTNVYRMKLRSYTKKKAAATSAGLRSKGQSRLGAINEVAHPPNISEQTEEDDFEGSVSSLNETEDEHMHSSDDSSSVSDDGSKTARGPIPNNKAPRTPPSSAARTKQSQGSFTSTKRGPWRIAYGAPKKRKYQQARYNPPKISDSSSTAQSTPTRQPRSIKRHNAQIIIKHGDLPTALGTPSPGRKPASEIRPIPGTANPFDIPSIQAREMEALFKQTNEIKNNVRLAQLLIQKDPEAAERWFNPQVAVPSGSRARRLGPHGTELID